MAGAIPVSAYVMSLTSMVFCGVVIFTVVRMFERIWHLGE